MRSLFVGSLGLLLFACGGAGAKSPSAATIDEQVAMGEKTYSEKCATCHGDQGDGGGAPALVGPKALDDYKNAKEAFNYIHKEMPPGKGGSLSDDEYWSVVAFLVKKNGIPVSSPLTPANAETVTWSR